MTSFDFVSFSRALPSSDWGVSVPITVRNSNSTTENDKSLLTQYLLANSIQLRPWSQVAPEKSLRCLNLIERIIKKNLGFCVEDRNNLSRTISQLLDNCVRVISLWFEFFEMHHEYLATKTQTDETIALKERLSDVYQGMLCTKIKITQLKTVLLSNSNYHRYRLISPSRQTILFSISDAPPAESFKFWRKIIRILEEDHPDFTIEIYGLTSALPRKWQASELKVPSCTVRFPAISSSSLPFPVNPSIKISKALWSLLKLHSQRFDTENIKIENSSQQTFEMVIQLLLSKKSIKITWINIFSLLNAAKELQIHSLETHLSAWLVTTFNAFDASNPEGYEKAKEWYPISSHYPLPELRKSLTRFFNRRLQSSLKEIDSLGYFESCIEDFRRFSIEEVDLRELEKDSHRSNESYLRGISRISTLKRLYLGEYPIIDDDVRHLALLNQLEHLEALDCRLLETDALTYLSRMTSLTSLSLLKLVKPQKNDFFILGRLPLTEASFLALNHIEADSFKLLTQLQTLALIKIRNLPEGLIENLAHITTLRTMVLDRISEIKYFYELKTLSSLTELHIWECSGAPRYSILNLSTPHLRKLALYGSQLDDPGVKDLHLLSNLESLSLSCSITTLGSLYSLNKLRELNLSGCSELPNESLERLSCLTALNQVRLIDCRKITNAGLLHVKKISGLTILDLRSSSFSLEGLEQLLEMPHLSEIYLSKDHSAPTQDPYSRFIRKALLNNIKVTLSKSFRSLENNL